MVIAEVRISCNRLHKANEIDMLWAQGFIILSTADSQPLILTRIGPQRGLSRKVMLHVVSFFLKAAGAGVLASAGAGYSGRIPAVSVHLQINKACRNPGLIGGIHRLDVNNLSILDGE